MISLLTVHFVQRQLKTIFQILIIKTDLQTEPIILFHNKYIFLNYSKTGLFTDVNVGLHVKYIIDYTLSYINCTIYTSTKLKLLSRFSSPIFCKRICYNYNFSVHLSWGESPTGKLKTFNIIIYSERNCPILQTWVFHKSYFVT